MNIFKDDYLLTKFINPNYRGIIGWSCSYYVDYPPIGVDSFSDRLLICVDSDYATFKTMEDCNLGDVEIKQFTINDIPDGEIVWMRHFDGGPNNWIRGFWEKDMDKKFNHYIFVPYLIAETAEKAEELRDWNKV